MAACRALYETAGTRYAPDTRRSYDTYVFPELTILRDGF